MSRTFVRAELVEGDRGLDARFSTAMGELGFVSTVNGRMTGKPLRLPTGMYLIEGKTAAEALELTREASRAANVRTRIFCVPVASEVRFRNLMFDEMSSP